MDRKKMGLVLNPVAGIGGTVGLKGSDGPAIQQLAQERGAVKKVQARVRQALEILIPLKDSIEVYAAAGEMGGDLASSMGFTTHILGSRKDVTTAADTEEAVDRLCAIPVDALLFAGGDGTARNVCEAIAGEIPVVGVPAGVKIHSAVYATTPLAAGQALYACLTGAVSLRQAEVMDIDEDAYRAGHVQTQLYGYLKVPALRGIMQHPKAASHLAINDVRGICEEILDRMSHGKENICYIFGAGSTVVAVEQSMGVEGTLLGIDVVQNEKLIAKDLAESELLDITARYPSFLIITAIGGQGHILGRGNQQLSPAVLRQIGLDNIWIVAAASKIFSLPDQCLYVDTGDERLDQELRGFRRVIVGWQEMLLCQVK